MDTNHQAGSTDAIMPTGAAPQRSIWSIIVGVFTAPTQAFEDFKRKPQILIPLIVSIILTGLVAGATAKYSALLQYDMMKTSTVIPPQALQEMKNSAESTGAFGVMGAGGGAVVIVIMGVLSALIALFLGNVVFGGTGKFKAVWGVELLTGLIVAVGGLVRLPLVLAKGSMQVSFGLAAFMGGEAFTSFLYMLLYFLDAFAIWAIIVAGFGYASIFGLSRGKGIAVAAISTGLLILLMITMQIVGMSFAGVEVSFF